MGNATNAYEYRLCKINKQQSESTMNTYSVLYCTLIIMADL